MIITVSNYTFNSIAFNHQQVTFNDYTNIELERIVRIYNLTTNNQIWDLDPLFISTGSVSGNVFDTNRAFAPMASTDKIHIEYDDPGMDIPRVITDGRKTVTTAGTAVPISATPSLSKGVSITALSTNTGTIVVGGPSVIAAPATRRGTPLSTGDTCILDIADLNKVYIDATVNGEGISFTVVN